MIRILVEVSYCVAYETWGVGEVGVKTVYMACGCVVVASLVL